MKIYLRYLFRSREEEPANNYKGDREEGFGLSGIHAAEILSVCNLFKGLSNVVIRNLLLTTPKLGRNNRIELFDKHTIFKTSDLL